MKKFFIEITVFLTGVLALSSCTVANITGTVTVTQTVTATNTMTITQDLSGSSQTATSLPEVLTGKDKVEIYTAVVRQVYAVDDTFGGTARFPVIYLMRQTSITESEQTAIIDALDDLPASFIWIDDRDEVMDDQEIRVKGNAAIIAVSILNLRESGIVEVAAEIYISLEGAGGRTYVVELIDGVWKITGNVGPVWVA